MLLDGSLRAALVATRSLGSVGLRVGVADGPHAGTVPATASRWCSFRGELPGRGDPNAYIDGLLRLLEVTPTKVVIPVHDASVEALRSRRSEFDGRTVLALMDEPALALATDKVQTLCIAETLGIPVPAGRTITQVSDCAGAARELGFPLVVKPAQSWTAQSAHVGRLVCEVVANRDELDTAVAKVLNAGSVALLQTWAGGAKEAVSVFFADGRIWARFAQVAHRTYPAMGGNSVLRESIPLPGDATVMAERLVREMGLTGYSEVEFRRDAAGRPLLMEINPRLSASVEAATRSGVDFPRLIYSWAAGDKLDAVDGYRVGVRVRWLGGDLLHLRQAFRQPGQPDVPSKQVAVRDFVADVFKPTAYDYLDGRDLRPAVSACAGFCRAMFARARKPKGPHGAVSNTVPTR
jgi:predicted ATP-grasp superfamily ATP-dependent carboligase